MSQQQRKVKAEPPKIAEKDLEIEPDEEPVAVPKKRAASPPEKAPKKKEAKKKRVKKESEEEEEEEKPAAAAIKKKKAKKEQKKPQPEEEEEEEEEPVSAAVPQEEEEEKKAPKEKKKRGPVKVSNKGVAKGDCLGTVAPFKLIGKKPGSGKSKSGQVAARERRHLQSSNGILLCIAPVERIARAAAESARRILEQEAAPQIARLRKNGKSPATNLTLSSVAEPRSISDGAKRLLTIAADVDARRVFDMANLLRIHAGGRETLFGGDVEKAIEMIDAQQ